MSGLEGIQLLGGTGEAAISVPWGSTGQAPSTSPGMPPGCCKCKPLIFWDEIKAI